MFQLSTTSQRTLGNTEERTYALSTGRERGNFAGVLWRDSNKTLSANERKTGSTGNRLKVKIPANLT